MLTFSSKLQIFAYVPPTDMRKGFAGLSAIIREEFQADPTDGSLFLFINKRRDRMKLLHYVEGGFCCTTDCSKREPLKRSRRPIARRAKYVSMLRSCRCSFQAYRWLRQASVENVMPPESKLVAVPKKPLKLFQK